MLRNSLRVTSEVIEAAWSAQATRSSQREGSIGAPLVVRMGLSEDANFYNLAKEQLRRLGRQYLDDSARDSLQTARAAGAALMLMKGET